MKNKHTKIIGKILGLAVVIVLIVWVNKWAIESDMAISLTEKFGYAGAFLSSFLSGFNVIVPIPIIGFYPFFVEAGLNPIIIILTVSLGMIGGDTLGYLIGNVGRDVIEEKKKYGNFFKRLEKIHKKHPRALIVLLFFYAGFVPLPNELIVIPMAFLGYKFRYMILALFVGNIIFNSLAAFGFFHLVNF